MAAGDYNGDGYGDLAVGAPKEDFGDRKSTGSVLILFGAPQGISAAGNEVWTQAGPGVGSQPQQRDRFGASLAAADFNDDGFSDLAVGVPGENVAGARNSGAVNILQGRRHGLVARPGNLLIQGRNGLVGNAEAGDRFGAKLQTIDIDGTDLWDLIIGIPGEDLAAENAGAAILVRSSPKGLDLDMSSVWHQDIVGVAGTVESGDKFGNLA